MDMPRDERFNALSEIANDCFGIDAFARLPGVQDSRDVAVRTADIVRALESAYDIGLIAGYHLNRTESR
ncbi:hypothetical protein PQQ51_21625 [Paraburkholderia xenovorans]|uniref:hypothetical protein n=1 Tax=Paraburkholderia xenovorans TaxID=36873 RepID=UPI0038BDC805